MRLFIAIDLADVVRQRIAEFAAELHRVARGASWTKSENYHLTLKFLGHVEEEKVGEIESALVEVAAHHSAFDLDFIGAGTFPNPRAPRVIWVGGHDRSGAVYQLQVGAEAAMKSLGFPPEDRAFTAHLTIARIKHAAHNPKLAAALEEAKARSFGIVRVERLHLIESQLNPQGAIYTKIGSWELGGST